MATTADNFDAHHGDHAHHDADHKPGFFARWFMSTNHKDIGILYLFVSGFVGLIAVAFTVFMRLELMNPGASPNRGYLYLHYFWSPSPEQLGPQNQVPDSADELPAAERRTLI